MGLKRETGGVTPPPAGRSSQAPDSQGTNLPAHPRKVSPEITSSVSRADVEGVHQDGVTLWDIGHAVTGCNNSTRRQSGDGKSEMGVNLQEAADVDFVVYVHEDHVLEEPEERPGVFFAGLQELQDPVILKEESAGAL